ncbi:MAG: hypothetical protein BGO49_01900 [Planctomycetales bacterium 71-10]|nr:MAG: hypothetical protein BGO49_01900 [Planctomycetales bacterium 71-10]
MKRAALATAGTTRAVALIGVLFAAGAGTADDGLEPLRWKLDPGREYRYTLSQATVLDSTPEGGGPIHSERRQEVDFRWVVGEAREDCAEVALVVDRLRVHVAREGLPGGFDFDTATDDAAPGDPHSARVAALLKGLVGSRITFRLTPRGEVRDVRLPDELSAALRRPDASGEGVLASEEGVRNLIAVSVPFLPEGPSGPGTMWTRQVAAPMPTVGSLILDKTYTDRGPRADRPQVHDVDVETRFSLQPMPGSTVAMKLEKQSGAGSFAFDARRGLVESGRLEDSLTIRFTADGRSVVQTASAKLGLKLEARPAP